MLAAACHIERRSQCEKGDLQLLRPNVELFMIRLDHNVLTPECEPMSLGGVRS